MNNNKKWICAITIIALVMQFSLKSIGQTFQYGNPANPEQNMVASSSINNTGCDIQPFASGGNMGVAVCDGATPSFSWVNKANNISGSASIAGVSGGGAITDPDVVLTQGYSNPTAIIVYVQNNNIYYETWQWNGSVFFNNQSATLLSVANWKGVTCSYPNIDMGYSNSNNTTYIAATWIQASFITNSSTVIGCAGYFNGTNFVFGPTIGISSGANAYQPDVCISGVNNGTLNINYITFTYIQGSPTGTHSLCSIGETYSSLIAGTAPNNPTTLMTVSYPTTLSRPRIAANYINYQAYQKDCEIVAEYQSAGNYSIIGFNTYMGVQSPMVDITPSPDIRGSYNGLPAVSFSADCIAVTWTSASVTPSNTPNDILSRRLSVSGNVFNPYSTFYSVVNNTLSNNQAISSIASKYSNTNSRNWLYVWVQRALQYKITPYNTPNLKLANINNAENTENTETRFYPIPASNNLNLDLGNDNSWIGSTAEIIDIEGQIVNKSIINNLSTSINVKDLKDGLYFVKVINGDNIITKKIIIKH